MEKTRLELLIYCYQEKKIKTRLSQARSYQNDSYKLFFNFYTCIRVWRIER